MRNVKNNKQIIFIIIIEISTIVAFGKHRLDILLDKSLSVIIKNTKTVLEQIFVYLIISSLSYIISSNISISFFIKINAETFYKASILTPKLIMNFNSKYNQFGY